MHVHGQRIQADHVFHRTAAGVLLGPGKFLVAHLTAGIRHVGHAVD